MQTFQLNIKLVKQHNVQKMLQRFAYIIYRKYKELVL